MILISVSDLASSTDAVPSVPTLGRGDDQIEFVPQPVRQLVDVRTAIRINDDRNGEHAGVRQSLEVEFGLSFASRMNVATEPLWRGGAGCRVRIRLPAGLTRSLEHRRRCVHV